VALCDVDTKKCDAALAKHPGARTYQDFRKMFDEMGRQFDAVTVATPDHTHAVAVVRALKEKKHVYSEKPLAHSIFEVRAIQKAMYQSKCATQLGNQGHSSDSIRRFCEMIWSGAIGEVREVHAWCGSNYSVIRNLERAKQGMPVPENVDWDLWLGPAPFRPYNPCYLPGTWRGWLQFGTGVIGDWVCHVVDPVFWALDLGAPSTIQAEVFDYDPKLHAESCPPGTKITYQFPAKGKRAPVKLVWYDGNQKPATPPEMKDEKLPGTGALVIGDKGKIIYGSHGAGSCRLIPDEVMTEYRKVEKPSRIPKVEGQNHHGDWLQACKGGKQAGSHFGYGGPLTEIALLGAIAFRLPGTKLQWDTRVMKFANSAEANRYVVPQFRQGWAL
jgi:predicted dehydrogenase